MAVAAIMLLALTAFLRSAWRWLFDVVIVVGSLYAMRRLAFRTR